MPDEIFGPYRLGAPLGRGGMGEVFRAFDGVRHREVALKLLHRELAAQPEFRERFRREARLAARLQEPHIVPIHDFGEIDGRLFLDMRLVEGRDAAELLAVEGPFDPRRAVDVVTQVASALDAAHAAGMVHRDVKPSNILVTASGFAYLCDFGVARAVLDVTGGFATAAGGTLVGSLTYMSPEQFTGARLDGRTDVYALACVLHELLAGRPPFSGSSLPTLMRAHLDQPPPPLRLLRRDLPPAFDAVLARGLAKRPEDRFPTAGALAASARSALDPPQPVATPPPAAPWRRALLVAGALAAAAVIAVATAVAVTSGGGAPAPTPSPSPSPVAAPTTTRPPPSLTVGEGLSAEQQELVGLLAPGPYLQCGAPQITQDAPGSITAVECVPRGLGPVTSVVVVRFASEGDLSAYLARDATGVSTGPDDDQTNCRNGQRVGNWDRGRVVCRPGTAAGLRIVWTEDARLLFAYAEGDPTVYSAWWAANAALTP